MEYVATRELFSQSNIIINCKTKKEAIKITSIAHYLGFTWNSGRSYIQNDTWNYYKEKTGYQFSKGLRGGITSNSFNNCTIIDSKRIKYLKHKIKIYKI